MTSVAAADGLVSASLIALFNGTTKVIRTFGDCRVLLPILALVFVLWRVHVRRQARRRTRHRILEEATGIEIATCWVLPRDSRPTSHPNNPFTQKHIQYRDWSKTARRDVSAWVEGLPASFEEEERPFESNYGDSIEPPASFETTVSWMSEEEGSQDSFSSNSGSKPATSLTSATSSEPVNIWIQVGNDDREELLASCTIPDASIKALFDCVHEGAEVELRSKLVELWCESSPGKMNFVEDDEALRKWLAKGQGSLQCRVVSAEDLEGVEFFEEIQAWGADEEASNG